MSSLISSGTGGLGNKALVVLLILGYALLYWARRLQPRGESQRGARHRLEVFRAKNYALLEPSHVGVASRFRLDDYQVKLIPLVAPAPPLAPLALPNKTGSFFFPVSVAAQAPSNNDVARTNAAAFTISDKITITSIVGIFELTCKKSIVKLPCQHFCAYAEVSGLVKGVGERLSICRRRERGSVEPRREKVRATIRPANAENQPEDTFRRFDRVDNMARLVGFLVGRVEWTCLGTSDRGLGQDQAREVSEVMGW
jgi:hypothetical protein